ncbi:MAG: rhamnosyltransferase [Candidatus Omnitrophota bacterium]
MKIVSVIVCYFPDVENLRRLCQTIIGSNAAVIIVNNGGSGDFRYSGFKDCGIISPGENLGVARAQNIGIRKALDEGADIVVFFDQDSSIEAGFLSRLISVLKKGTPGIAAPVFFDRKEGYEFPSMKLNRLGLFARVYRKDAAQPYEVDAVISSGMAVTAKTFEIAGMMDEDFFIDFVDTEWCLRCRRKNVPIHVVPIAEMRHSVGESSIDFGFMRGFIHSPDRSYYKLRNCFLLFRKKHIPFQLAIRETISALVHYVALVVFQKNKMEYVKIFLISVWHGFSGVAGKRP